MHAAPMQPLLLSLRCAELAATRHDTPTARSMTTSLPYQAPMCMQPLLAVCMPCTNPSCSFSPVSKRQHCCLSVRPSHATITAPQLRSPRPPVLAAAEGDEHMGENAGQFSDLDKSGRQDLIDKKSQSSSN